MILPNHVGGLYCIYPNKASVLLTCCRAIIC